LPNELEPPVYGRLREDDTGVPPGRPATPHIPPCAGPHGNFRLSGAKGLLPMRATGALTVETFGNRIGPHGPTD
jgi:hypothetical protein